MRRLNRILLLSLAFIAIPAFAARSKDQSYVSYDEGGTIIKQGEDGREVDARVNVPIYPGDQVTTGQRGRTEIRLADGNVIALDRMTSVIFQSIYDSYEGDAAQSVIQLVSGHIAVQRTDDATEQLRVDALSASYVASDPAVYSVDEDGKGRDRVMVFDGAIELRTPQRSTRVQAGEEARIDDQGIYGLTSSPQNAADEFERWFRHRSDRYQNASSQYLDDSLAYSDADLQDNGSWFYDSSFGAYAWRPRVAVGWRPYYYGRWGYGPGGCLTWISYEPWGWVPFHYGRWAFDASFGWVWLPGYTYAPAWVYWAYGPGYIGWAPAGWYDCYRPYYGWAYRPYARGGFDFGFGFYGRVHMNEVDLRPWTFVNADHIVSGRVDQTALNSDLVRQRLIRDPNATVTGTPARFDRFERRDPAAAVNNIARRGLVGGTGPGSSGTVADMTPFFRRDSQLSPMVRDRIVRSRAVEPVATPHDAGRGVVVTPGSAPTASAGAPSGIPSPGTRGTLEGRVGNRDKSGSDRGDFRPGEATGGVLDDPYGHRGAPPANPAGSAAPAAPTNRPVTTPEQRDNNNWRSQNNRGTAPPPSSSTSSQPRQNWRNRSVGTGADRSNPTVPNGETQQQQPRDRGADIPRKIIDRIGGARVYGEPPRDTSAPPPQTRDASAPPPQTRDASAPPPQTRSSEAPPPRQEQKSSPPREKSSKDSSGSAKHHR